MADLETELLTARAHLAAWLDASLKVAQGQAVSLSGPLGSNSLTRAPLADIREQIKYWKAEVERLERAATNTRTGIGCQRIILHG
jgi:hypothetical protein